MIAAYRQIPRKSECAPKAPVMPATRCALEGSATGFHELADGRVMLEVNGQGVGIYPSQAAAQTGLQIFQRMGVAR